MTVLLIVTAMMMSLILGAIWGAYLTLPTSLEGFLVALAGGALIVALMDELMGPGAEALPLALAMGAVLAGAAGFTLANEYIDSRFSGGGGLGLLLAVTFDGIPENLALGTALVGGSAASVAALAVSIFLSNLPEAAGGAKEMVENGWSRRQTLGVWTGAAVALSLAAFGGYGLAGFASDPVLAILKCVAAGAVVASLAIEIFPQAFREDSRGVGIAVALGLILAYSLTRLG